MNKQSVYRLFVPIVIVIVGLIFSCVCIVIFPFERRYLLLLLWPTIILVSIAASLSWYLLSPPNREDIYSDSPLQPSSSKETSVSPDIKGHKSRENNPQSNLGSAHTQSPQKEKGGNREKTKPFESFEPKTKAQYREEKLAEFHNWQYKVQREEGIIINTQGPPSGAFEAPQVFFMRTEFIVVPAYFSRANPPHEVLAKVQVSQSTFYEVGRRKPEDYYHQAIYSIDSQANSPIRAQELLWQLESYKLKNDLYMVPVIRHGKPCWLPLQHNQFHTWRKHLRATVRSFEKLGLTYEEVKNLQQRCSKPCNLTTE